MHYVIVLHSGAGYHAPVNEQEYRSVVVVRASYFACKLSGFRLHAGRVVASHSSLRDVHY